MANVNYNNCKDLDVRLASSDMFYEPNIPVFAQLHTPRPRPIERMYIFPIHYNKFLAKFSKNFNRIQSSDVHFESALNS